MGMNLIDKKDRPYILFAFRIAGDFVATIGIPAVLLAWIGSRLEERYGIAPWGIVFGLMLAAIFSGVNIYRKAKAYGRKYSEMADEEKKHR